MLSTSARLLPRRIVTAARPATRRFLSTTPPTQKSRSWKSSAVRWGLAAGGVYYYNTYASEVFAEETDDAINRLDASLHRTQESNLPTLDAIIEEKRAREAAQADANRKTSSQTEPSTSPEQSESASPIEQSHEAGIEDLEEEADQQGAFNPETGEINWDCPCLGGMAHGPCGDEFREAFSCFVYSKEEPKGMECIEKFKGMQDCFRAHPEMYGSELEDDEDEVEAELATQEASRAAPQPSESSTVLAEAQAKTAEIGSEIKEGAAYAESELETEAEDLKAKIQTGAEDVKSKVKTGADRVKSNLESEATAVQASVQSGVEHVKEKIAQESQAEPHHQNTVDATTPST